MHGKTGLAVAALALALASVEIALADVEVSGDTDCYESAAMLARLETVLGEHRPEGRGSPNIRITTSDEAGTTHIVLTALTPDGNAALERSYALNPADCESAIDLVSAVVDRYLRSLPAESWPSPEPEPKPEPEPELEPEPEPELEPASAPFVLGLEPFVGVAGLVALWPTPDDSPLALEAAAVAGAELITRAGVFSAAALGRTGQALQLGPGRYRSIFVLGELGWRSHGRWRLGPGLRMGTLHVAGSGFDRNFSRWLLWIEGVASAGIRLSGFDLVVEAALSPIEQTVVTADRSASAVAPRLRLGLTLRAHF